MENNRQEEKCNIILLFVFGITLGKQAIKKWAASALKLGQRHVSGY